MGSIDINPDLTDLLGGWDWFPSVTVEIPPLNLDRTPPPPPKDEPIAHILWGGQTGISFSQEGGDITQIINGDGIPPVAGTLDFVEEERTEDVVRIFNPTNHDQWVDVARALTVTMRPPAELLLALKQPVTQRWRYIYHPPT
jgi:hypothetical protein